MKTKVAIIAVVIFLLMVIGLTLNFFAAPGPDSRDLHYWIKIAGTRDWLPTAANGDPQAQFFHGLTLLRSNVVISVDSVPRLSGIPVIGKRLFEHKSYRIDKGVSQERLGEAYLWINRSADEGFAPAKEARKLFTGRIATPDKTK